MFNGLVRFVIFVTTLFVAWLATGRLLAATHPTDLQWLGYVQATGIELVLGYCVWLIARTSEKGIIGLMILIFGLFSVSAQMLHAHFFGVPLPNEASLPDLLVFTWRYLLPAIPTMAGVSVGLLELAESRPGRSAASSRVSSFMRKLSGGGRVKRLSSGRASPAPAHTYAAEFETLPQQSKPRRRRKKSTKTA